MCRDGTRPLFSEIPPGFFLPNYFILCHLNDFYHISCIFPKDFWECYKLQTEKSDNHETLALEFTHVWEEKVSHWCRDTRNTVSSLVILVVKVLVLSIIHGTLSKRSVPSLFFLLSGCPLQFWKYKQHQCQNI